MPTSFRDFRGFWNLEFRFFDFGPNFLFASGTSVFAPLDPDFKLQLYQDTYFKTLRAQYLVSTCGTVTTRFTLWFLEASSDSDISHLLE